MGRFHETSNQQPAAAFTEISVEKSTHQPHQLIGTFKARGEVQEAACMSLVVG